MGIMDKAKNAAENAEGEAKEKLGEHTGDDEMKHDGQKDQVTSSVKDAGEDVKDALNK
jgi:uncharacterized protein YjbJ (UPF0337 family)